MTLPNLPKEKSINVPLHPACGCMFLSWIIAGPIALIWVIVHFVVKYW